MWSVNAAKTKSSFWGNFPNVAGGNINLDGSMLASPEENDRWITLAVSLYKKCFSMFDDDVFGTATLLCSDEQVEIDSYLLDKCVKLSKWYFLWSTSLRDMKTVITLKFGFVARLISFDLTDLAQEWCRWNHGSRSCTCDHGHYYSCISSSREDHNIYSPPISVYLYYCI